ncbi:MAG: hypothetical protein KDD69_06115 [Bdellovibrionales bacterium]|nr:hypothetical protein [Bdellovibrionales bacterium]
MKAQDIAVLLKVFLWRDRSWSQRELAVALGLSVSEANHALKRLALAKLYNPHRKQVIRKSAEELLLHGVKFFYPARIGAIAYGIPTAHAAKPLSDLLVFDAADKLVWPDANGEEKGQSLEPLYPTLPRAAKGDPELHELLALIDAIRAGGARERALAEEQLSARLLGT